jgi:hypothetical protein
MEVDDLVSGCFLYVFITTIALGIGFAAIIWYVELKIRQVMPWLRSVIEPHNWMNS